MNELIIILAGYSRLFGENRLYYKTNQTTRKSALCEFLDVCDKVGINVTDSCVIEDYILRNKDGEDIN